MLGRIAFNINGMRSPVSRSDFECDRGYVLADATAAGVTKEDRADIDVLMPKHRRINCSPPEKGLLQAQVRAVHLHSTLGTERCEEGCGGLASCCKVVPGCYWRQTH